jgi:hypothetical protein
MIKVERTCDARSDYSDGEYCFVTCPASYFPLSTYFKRVAKLDDQVIMAGPASISFDDIAGTDLFEVWHYGYGTGYHTLVVGMCISQ